MDAGHFENESSSSTTIDAGPSTYFGFYADEGRIARREGLRSIEVEIQGLEEPHPRLDAGRERRQGHAASQDSLAVADRCFCPRRLRSRTKLIDLAEYEQVVHAQPSWSPAETSWCVSTPC